MKIKNLFCRLACVGVTCSMLLSVCPYPAFAADKNNAERYEIGTTENASITEDTSEIYYVFELEESGEVETTLKLGTWDAYTYALYDDDGNRLYYEYAQDHTGDLTWDLSAGTYYLHFNNYMTNYGTFSFSTSFESADVNHDEDNAEKNNAAEISLNKKYNSIISKDKESEYFKFELEESGTVDAEIELGTWDAYTYALYDDYGNRLYYEYAQDHTGDLTWDLSAGTYYLHFNNYMTNYGTFSFSTSFKSADVNHDEDNAEKNNAAEISLNKKYNSIISKDKDSEYFTFELEESGMVDVEIELGTWDAYTYALYDDYGNRLYYEYAQDHTGDLTWDLSAGTYYLHFNNYMTNYGTFSFTLSDGGTVADNDEDDSYEPVRTPSPVNDDHEDEDKDDTPVKTPVPDNGNNIYRPWESDDQNSEYTDVYKSDSYYTAVNELSKRGIINGYEDGSFKPNKLLTRAEFTKLVVVLLGKENQAARWKGWHEFSDVGADHWASGYVAVGISVGFINGYGDGTFGPEETVRYAQAIKMLVCAAGYEQEAWQNGAWPTGYNIVATELGINDDVYKGNDDELSRGEAAIMIYNTLAVIE